MSGEMKAFYMTLAPTVKAKTEEEYDQLLSDFETQLRKPIKLDSKMKWRVTMPNIFIPLDTRRVSKSDYNRHSIFVKSPWTLCIFSFCTQHLSPSSPSTMLAVERYTHGHRKI